MQKRALPFSKVREPDFIDCGRANRPGVRNIYLLSALVRQIAESWKRSATRLESREGLLQVVLVEIVVAGEMLVLRQLMINLYCKLIASLVPERNSLECAVRAIGLRN